ncbi:MAG TPA: hypothetical protein VLB05_01060 [Dongiaceae bacterium]|nr:hypothetical protein [Dongiaceae bacterium]
MNQLGGGRRRAACEVGLLAQIDGEAAPGGVARNPAAIDPAADDGNVENACQPAPLTDASFLFRIAAKANLR